MNGQLKAGGSVTSLKTMIMVNPTLQKAVSLPARISQNPQACMGVQTKMVTINQAPLKPQAPMPTPVAEHSSSSESAAAVPVAAAAAAGGSNRADAVKTRILTAIEKACSELLDFIREPVDGSSVATQKAYVFSLLEKMCYYADSGKFTEETMMKVITFFSRPLEPCANQQKNGVKEDVCIKPQSHCRCVVARLMYELDSIAEGLAPPVPGSRGDLESKSEFQSLVGPMRKAEHYSQIAKKAAFELRQKYGISATKQKQKKLRNDDEDGNEQLDLPLHPCTGKSLPLSKEQKLEIIVAHLLASDQIKLGREMLFRRQQKMAKTKAAESVLTVQSDEEDNDDVVEDCASIKFSQAQISKTATAPFKYRTPRAVAVRLAKAAVPSSVRLNHFMKPPNVQGTHALKQLFRDRTSPNRTAKAVSVADDGKTDKQQKDVDRSESQSSFSSPLLAKQNGAAADHHQSGDKQSKQPVSASTKNAMTPSKNSAVQSSKTAPPVPNSSVIDSDSTTADNTLAANFDQKAANYKPTRLVDLPKQMEQLKKLQQKQHEEQLEPKQLEKQELMEKQDLQKLPKLIVRGKKKKRTPLVFGPEGDEYDSLDWEIYDFGKFNPTRSSSITSQQQTEKMTRAAFRKRLEEKEEAKLLEALQDNMESESMANGSALVEKQLEAVADKNLRLQKTTSGTFVETPISTSSPSSMPDRTPIKMIFRRNKDKDSVYSSEHVEDSVVTTDHNETKTTASVTADNLQNKMASSHCSENTPVLTTTIEQVFDDCDSVDDQEDHYYSDEGLDPECCNYNDGLFSEAFSNDETDDDDKTAYFDAEDNDFGIEHQSENMAQNQDENDGPEIDVQTISTSVEVDVSNNDSVENANSQNKSEEMSTNEDETSKSSAVQPICTSSENAVSNTNNAEGAIAVFENKAKPTIENVDSESSATQSTNTAIEDAVLNSGAIEDEVQNKNEDDRAEVEVIDNKNENLEDKNTEVVDDSKQEHLDDDKKFPDETAKKLVDESEPNEEEASVQNQTLDETFAAAVDITFTPTESAASHFADNTLSHSDNDEGDDPMMSNPTAAENFVANTNNAEDETAVNKNNDKSSVESVESEFFTANSINTQHEDAVSKNDSVENVDSENKNNEEFTNGNDLSESSIVQPITTSVDNAVSSDAEISDLPKKMLATRNVSVDSSEIHSTCASTDDSTSNTESTESFVAKIENTSNDNNSRKSFVYPNSSPVKQSASNVVENVNADAANKSSNVQSIGNLAENATINANNVENAIAVIENEQMTTTKNSIFQLQQQSTVSTENVASRKAKTILQLRISKPCEPVLPSELHKRYFESKSEQQSTVSIAGPSSALTPFEKSTLQKTSSQQSSNRQQKLSIVLNAQSTTSIAANEKDVNEEPSGKRLTIIVKPIERAAKEDAVITPKTAENFETNNESKSMLTNQKDASIESESMANSTSVDKQSEVVSDKKSLLRKTTSETFVETPISSSSSMPEQTPIKMIFCRNKEKDLMLTNPLLSSLICESSEVQPIDNSAENAVSKTNDAENANVVVENKKVPSDENAANLVIVSETVNHSTCKVISNHEAAENVKDRNIDSDNMLQIKVDNAAVLSEGSSETPSSSTSSSADNQQSVTVAEATNGVPIKRKRGRPRKDDLAWAAEKAKRHQATSKETSIIFEGRTSARRQSSLLSTPAIVRPKAKPKQTPAPLFAADGVTPIKRGRGRPRKYPREEKPAVSTPAPQLKTENKQEKPEEATSVVKATAANDVDGNSNNTENSVKLEVSVKESSCDTDESSNSNESTTDTECSFSSDNTYIDLSTSIDPNIGPTINSPISKAISPRKFYSIEKEKHSTENVASRKAKAILQLRISKPCEPAMPSELHKRYFESKSEQQSADSIAGPSSALTPFEKSTLQKTSSRQSSNGQQKLSKVCNAQPTTSITANEKDVNEEPARRRLTIIVKPIEHAAKEEIVETTKIAQTKTAKKIKVEQLVQQKKPNEEQNQSRVAAKRRASEIKSDDEDSLSPLSLRRSSRSSVKKINYFKMENGEELDSGSEDKNIEVLQTPAKKRSRSLSQSSSVSAKKIKKEETKKTTKETPNHNKEQPTSESKDENILGMHVKANSLECRICGRKNLKEDQLNNHLFQAHKQYPFPCIYGCSEVSFNNKTAISKHYLDVHSNIYSPNAREGIEWNCFACKKDFGWEIKFNNHSSYYSHYNRYHQMGDFGCKWEECKENKKSYPNRKAVYFHIFLRHNMSNRRKIILANHNIDSSNLTEDELIKEIFEKLLDDELNKFGIVCWEQHEAEQEYIKQEKANDPNFNPKNNTYLRESRDSFVEKFLAKQMVRAVTPARSSKRIASKSAQSLSKVDGAVKEEKKIMLEEDSTLDTSSSFDQSLLNNDDKYGEYPPPRKFDPKEAENEPTDENNKSRHCVWPGCDKTSLYAWNLTGHIRSQHMRLPKTVAEAIKVKPDAPRADNWMVTWNHSLQKIWPNY